MNRRATTPLVRTVKLSRKIMKEWGEKIGSPGPLVSYKAGGKMASSHDAKMPE
jgi:hypothetical protein